MRPDATRMASAMRAVAAMCVCMLAAAACADPAPIRLAQAQSATPFPLPLPAPQSAPPPPASAAPPAPPPPAPPAPPPPPPTGTSTSQRLATLPPNTAINLGLYNPPPQAGCGALTSGITDYSRLTYDSIHHQFLMFGGGHATTPRDDVDVFDLATLTWHSAYPSTPGWDMKVANFNPDTGGWISTGHPLARHTYDLLPFAPNVGELILLQPVSTQPYCMETYQWEAHGGRIWHYNPATKQWRAGAQRQMTGSFPAAEYDPVSGKIIMVGSYGLYSYDPVTQIGVQNQSFARAELSYAQNLVYFPPTDRMYYITNPGVVFEVTLDRRNLANSKIVRMTGVTGTPRPSGQETGWAYDSTNRIIGGGIVNGVFYAFNPIAKTWSSRRIQTPPGTDVRDLGTIAFHAIDYDPVDNVYIFQGKQTVGGSTHTTWAYRYDVGTATPPPAPPPSGAADSDFNARCHAAGVVKCVGFDQPSDLQGGYGTNAGVMNGTSATPGIDTAVKASGAGSLRFTIPSKSGANGAGTYFTNFSRDLSVQFGASSEFYVQWRQRFSPAFISTVYRGSGGIKQAIITAGDKPNRLYASCEAIGLVVQTYYLNRFPILYDSCTGSTSHGPYQGLFEPYRVSGDDYKLQNGRPAPYCLYSQRLGGHFLPPDGNCYGWFPNEWMTFQVRIRTGPRVNDEFTQSRVSMWIARAGHPSELVIDFGPYNLSAGSAQENERFGKIWLLPYQTGKDASQAHETAYTWYDELIVSTQRIPDPK